MDDEGAFALHTGPRAYPVGFFVSLPPEYMDWHLAPAPVSLSRRTPPLSGTKTDSAEVQSSAFGSAESVNGHHRRPRGPFSMILGVLDASGRRTKRSSSRQGHAVPPGRTRDLGAISSHRECMRDRFEITRAHGGAWRVSRADTRLVHRETRLLSYCELRTDNLSPQPR